jgi:hypothetical protein
MAEMAEGDRAALLRGVRALLDADDATHRKTSNHRQRRKS